MSGEYRHRTPKPIYQTIADEIAADISGGKLGPDEPIPSGAGHDAAVFAQAGVPSAMIFIRNQHGSHNPAEAMEMEDFLIGAELLERSLREVAS